MPYKIRKVKNQSCYKVYNAKTKKTVAPKENINHIPADVLKVKNARTPMTIDADTPEIIGSIFFDIFISSF